MASSISHSPSTSSPSSTSVWDRETDFLVIGAGAGGMSAALAAAIEGLDVVVCESTTQVGGTAATSAGTIWIPGNRQSLQAGFEDNADAARTYMDGLVAGTHGALLRDAYLATGPDVVDWFALHSEVKFDPSGKHPDYRDAVGAAVSGRALAPRTFDASVLGTAFAAVRPPIPEFMVFGGMMVGKDDIPRLLDRFKSPGNFMHAARLFFRYIVDRARGFPRGTRVVMGNAFVARLFYSLRQRNVPVLFETQLQDLAQRDGAVLGAVVSMRGQRQRIRARRGVVLATGGFAHNEAMRKRFMAQPTPVHSMAPATHRGEGISIGMRIGALVEPERHGSGGFWTPASLTPRADGSTGLYPHLSLDRAKPGLIAVNQAGERFVNEANSYHDFVLGMFEAQKRSPSIPAHLVCSEAFVRRYGLGMIHPKTNDITSFIRNGYLVSAPTLDDLARKIGVDAAGLQSTVRRYDEMARRGVDEDFAKGSTELNRFNGDASVGPNPCMAPLGPGPYCALAVYPAEIACSTGLVTDENARVLSAEGPIEGLYACGNDMASIMSGTYPGPGTTLGPALVFGWRAAMHAKSRLPVEAASSAVA
jgi:succinate dehydrogenase/fumarate reductase flavoprotein subunit